MGPITYKNDAGRSFLCEGIFALFLVVVANILEKQARHDKCEGNPQVNEHVLQRVKSSELCTKMEK